MENIQVLCVDDEKNVLRALERTFFDEPYAVKTALSAEEGLALLREEDCQVIISDYRMPQMSGVQFLHEVKKQWPDTVRVVLSGYADVASIVSAINEGEIYKFIPKPWNDDELKVTVWNAIERFTLRRENKELTRQLKEKNQILEELNKNLEQKVQEKTADILIQNKTLRRSQEILDIIPVCVVGIDNDGTIVQINKAAENILKYKNDNLLGTDMCTVFTDHLVAGITRSAETQCTVKEQVQEDFFKGTVVLVPLMQEGKPIGTVVVFCDRQELEADNKVLNKQKR